MGTPNIWVSMQEKDLVSDRCVAGLYSQPPTSIHEIDFPLLVPWLLLVCFQLGIFLICSI